MKAKMERIYNFVSRNNYNYTKGEIVTKLSDRGQINYNLLIGTVQKVPQNCSVKDSHALVLKTESQLRALDEHTAFIIHSLTFHMYDHWTSDYNIKLRNSKRIFDRNAEVKIVRRWICARTGNFYNYGFKKAEIIKFVAEFHTRRINSSRREDSKKTAEILSNFWQGKKPEIMKTVNIKYGDIMSRDLPVKEAAAWLTKVAGLNYKDSYKIYHTKVGEYNYHNIVKSDVFTLKDFKIVGLCNFLEESHKI